MGRQDTRFVSRAVYQMSVATFIASVVWISMGVYNALTEPVDVNVSAEILEPINPTIDLEVLRGLKEREQLSESVDEYLVNALDEGTLPTSQDIEEKARLEEPPEEEEEELEEEIEEENEATGSGSL